MVASVDGTVSPARPEHDGYGFCRCRRLGGRRSVRIAKRVLLQLSGCSLQAYFCGVNGLTMWATHSLFLLGGNAAAALRSCW